MKPIIFYFILPYIIAPWVYYFSALTLTFRHKTLFTPINNAATALLFMVIDFCIMLTIFCIQGIMQVLFPAPLHNIANFPGFVVYVFLVTALSLLCKAIYLEFKEIEDLNVFDETNRKLYVIAVALTALHPAVALVAYAAERRFPLIPLY